MSSNKPAGSLASEDLQLGILRPYQAPVFGTALMQAISTFGLYIACTVAMYISLRVSAWITLALAIPASGLIVRIFMLQHDCGHNSFFRSRRLNLIVGTACSLVTFTPFAYWRRLHARHHRSWNNLDDRGIAADFFSDCATVAEYQAMTRAQKTVYRLTHHPILVHLLLPPIVFILVYRLPFDMPPACRRERVSVYLLNLALMIVLGGLIMAFGIKTVLLVHLPAIVLAAIVGIWLFSVQHRFEDAHWARQTDWTSTRASLHGASYLKLPALLQWFSGNIGLHHVHHLRPGIPNYRLQACHDECPAVTAGVTMLTLKEALKAPSYILWDEDLNCMVPLPS
ncbi:MAG TPA: fatty acid desaturase [Acidocella sp.]|nr:fatty acid desaturase [Acidocella sp.]